MNYLRSLYNKINTWISDVKSKQNEEKRQRLEQGYDVFINGWGMETHCKDEQVVRFKRANTDNEISKHGYLNFYSLSTTFRSRKDPKQKYHTTLKNCTCPDFQHRNLPCKHMYKLAHSLGIIDETWDLSGVPSDVSSKIEALPKFSFNLFINIVSEHMKKNYSFSVKNNRNLTPIFESNLLINEGFDYTELSKYTKNDLIAAIATSGCDFKINSNTKKDELIHYIITSDNKKLMKLRSTYIKVRFPDDIVALTYYIHRKYLQQST